MVGSTIPGRCGPRLRCGILAALVSLPLLVDFARRSPAPRIALAVVAESVGVLLGGGQAAHAQTAPSAPTGLKAFPGSGVGQVTLLWDNPNNNTITRYEWRHRKPSHSSEWGEWVIIQFSNANTTHFRPGNLNVGTVYDIQVRAVAGNTVTVNGVSSASVSVTPPSTATTVVPTPTGLKAFAGPGAREVTLLWDNPKNGNITGYQYWMTPDRVWLSVSGSNAATTSFTVPSLTAGTTYGFQVRAVVGSLTGRETPWVGATPSANANKAPKVAIPIPDQTATADAAFSYTFPADTFTDEENDTLTYKFTQAVSANQPAWLRFNATTRTFSGTPNSLFATGFVWTITVTASDPFNSVSDSFSIRVRPAALTGLTAAAAPRRAEVTLTWDNPRIGNITGYQYRVRDSTKPSAQAVSAWASISVSRTVNTVSHTVTGLTANTHYSFQVRAVAGTVNSLETPWVNARTAASNAAPTVEKTIPDQTATAGAAFSYTFPADTFKDTDSTLTYKATKQNGTALPAWLSFNATTRTFSGTPNGNNAGTLTVKVTAIDDGPGDVSDSFRIRVNNVTSLAAPTGLTAATGPGAGEATLRWDNPKNSAISGYEYRQKAGTASYGTWTDISNSDKDTVEYTVTGLTAVYYSFRVRAVAGSLGGESTATVGLTVSSSVNAAPTVEKTIPDQTATAGAAFSYTFPADTFKDTDSTLTYKATKQNGTALPAWLSFNATTRTFSGTPGENDVDVLTVKVTATDGASDVSDSFYISVRPSAPTGLTATPGPGAGEVTLRWNRPKNSAIKGYQFRNRVDGITYRWRRLVVADVDSTSARVIPVPAAIYGRAYGFQIRLEAGRGRGWVVSESTAWVVATVSSSVNAAPTVEKTIPDQTATAGAAFSYTFPADTFKDTDSTLTYKATKQNGTALPAWLSFNATTRTFSGTPGGNDVGSLTVKVTATDGASDVSDSFDIVVSNVAALAAPTGLKVLAGPGAREVTLTWDDPGNKAVTRYQYRQKGSSRRYGAWTDISNSDKDTVRHTVTGLSRTISILQIVYTFQVRAVAGSLKGAASAAVTGSTEEKPSAPTGLTATAGPRGRQVTLQWTRPSPSANIRYQYRQKAGTASYGAWTDISNSDKNTVKHTVTGLTNGTAYTFQVRAVVGLVIGTASGAVTGTPFAEPPAPTGFKAATGPGAGEVTLRWDNPKNSAVSGYEYRQKAGTAPYGAWTDISNSDSDTVEYTVTGLTNGTAYTFQVRARIGTVSSAPSNNAVATPSSSGNAAPTVANAIPDQTATAGAAFSYTFPADTFKDTDSTLTYKATKQNGTALPAWLSFNATTRTFSGTPDGNDVGRLTVKVTATDGANDVSDSFGIIVITNAASLAAPTGLTATPGPGVGEITLKWAKPNNPESAVIGYQYRQKAGADPYGAWTDISNSDKDTVKHTVTGLTNGTTYTFQVRAKLKLTKGIASGDITATPLPPPAAPTGLAAAVQSARSSRDRSITLRWDDPRNPAITKWEYRLTYNWRGSRQIKPWTTISRAATTTSHTINSRVLSLSHSHGTYTIQVRARIGTTSGPWSVVRARLANWRTPVSGQAPTRTKPIPDQRAMAGAAFSYTFPADTFTDPDSSTLTYRATQQDDTALPAWLSFDAGKRTFSGTPGENDVGRLTVKVAASDSYNEASDSFVISIDDDASLAAGSITESGAVLTLSNGPGVWYYKETAPSGGSCSTAVSGASATLTGLSAATGYTYRAYGDSGCSEEVGRVSFSTGAVQPGVLLSADSLSLTELGGAAGEKRYRIRLSTDPGQDVTVTVKPVIGAGGVGAVTVEPAVGVSFTGGSGGNWGTEQAVRVSALNDGDVTGESFQISHSVTAPAGNEYENVTVGNVAVTVADAGHGVTASVDSLTVRENNGTASYGLRLESAPGGPVTVTPTVSDDSHVTVGGAVSFSDSDWSTAKSVTVTGVGAASDRASISHVVSVGTSAYPTTLSGLPVVAVTVTADSRPVVSIAGESATVTEGSGAGFRVSAVPAPAAPLVVNLTVGETGEGDFVLAGNEGSRTVTVPVTGSAVFTVNTETDSTDEPNGEVRVTVAGDGAYRGAPAATVTVMDDDATPVVLSRTGTGAIAEDGGAATLTVRLGRRLYGGERVTAPLVVSGVGISADDYTLTLAGGQGQNTGVSLSTSAPHSGAEPAVVFTGHDANTVQTATLWLAAIDDNANEGTGESLTVAFGSGNRAVVSTLDRVSGTGSDGVTASGTVTVSITDDDASLAAGSITESGAVLTLSNGPGVWYYKETAPSGGSCSTAVSGASATLTGLSAATGYTYRAYGDSGCSEEVGRVSFSTAANDVPSRPMLSVSDASAEEGEALEFVISLSQPYDSGMLVIVRTRESTARHGQDFRLRPDGQNFAVVTLHAGETEKTVSVSTLDDNDIYDSETFELYIDKVYFADDVEIADGVGVGTITNSDHNDVPSRPMLSVSDASAEEGEALEFVIRLSQPHDGEVAVVMRTREVVANAARQGQDFYLNSDNAVLVNFRPGDMEKTVLVSTMNDGNNHDVKTFELYISHGYASSGCVGVDDDVGMGIIGVVGDMSSLPLLSVGDASGKEGEALEFVVNLSSPLEKWVTVIVRTRESSPVSARNGQDFLLRCPDTTSVCSSDVGNDVENYIVMNFRPGETEKTVS
ncbi:MAG: putative Ig domain-containing protein, partial [Cyanobacteria bacterium MAG CAR3_bin_5]|nr:putative Ig domain-containing protein [Cyanobacteria bacterium MAG CAR3_bin_5]